MHRSVLHSKIHMARVTEADPDYIGSITIDEDILEAVGLRVSDEVVVANCRNGARLTTYVFRGEPGSGTIGVNGAAAHLVEPGDRIIVLHFALLSDEEYAEHRPRVAIMRRDNSVERILRYEPYGGDPPGELA